MTVTAGLSQACCPDCCSKIWQRVAPSPVIIRSVRQSVPSFSIARARRQEREISTRPLLAVYPLRMCFSRVRTAVACAAGNSEVSREKNHHRLTTAAVQTPPHPSPLSLVSHRTKAPTTWLDPAHTRQFLQLASSTKLTMFQTNGLDFIPFSSSSEEEGDRRDVTIHSEQGTPMPTRISAGYDHRGSRAICATEKRGSRSGLRTCCDQLAVEYAACFACDQATMAV
jgi:hypothetical protein